MSKNPQSVELPFDMVLEILVHLPVKSLVRFLCVSKQWNTHISRPQFQKEHHCRRSKQDPLLLVTTPKFEDDLYPTNILELSIRDGNDGAVIEEFSRTFPGPLPYCLDPIQSCKGLACLSYATVIFMFNPSSREVMALPALQRLNRCVGFGYAASTNEFKVVSLTIGSNYWEIFTLGSSTWRETNCPLPQSYFHKNLRAPFIHGAIHFLSGSRIPSRDDAICAFDLGSEEYTKIPVPEQYLSYFENAAASHPLLYLCLNELRGFLCLTFNLETSMELWFLQDYDERKWVKEYTIKLQKLSSDFLRGEPLAIMGNGTIILNIFEEEKDGGHLYCYNPENEHFMDYAEGDCMATMYVESLLPLPRIS